MSAVTNDINNTFYFSQQWSQFNVIIINNVAQLPHLILNFPYSAESPIPAGE